MEIIIVCDRVISCPFCDRNFVIIREEKDRRYDLYNGVFTSIVSCCFCDGVFVQEDCDE